MFVKASTYELRADTSKFFSEDVVPAIGYALTKIDEGSIWRRYSKADDPDNSYYNNSLQNGNEQIHLSYDAYTHRIAVTGHWPELPNGGKWHPGASPRITVSADREITAIAKDIARKFLPEYREALQRARKDIAEMTVYRDRTKDNFDKIIAAGAPYLRPSRNQSERASDRTIFVHEAPGISYGNIRVSANSVSFDHFSTTPEFAARIFALCQQYGVDFPKSSDEEE